MNKIKLSDSDKRLLIIFLAIVIVACSYFFIFNKEMSKAQNLEDQNTTDSATVQQMETKYLPLGFLDTVADRMRPWICLLTRHFTNPSFGS